MLSIRRVLFPTDFSAGATRAFPEAVSFATRHNAELHIVKVAEMDSERVVSLPVAANVLHEWLGQQSSIEEADLEALTVIQRQLEPAPPSERLVEYADGHDIDLVVMGTHGRRGVDRMLFGSVTEEVVRTASCPVFTVRADADVTPSQAIRRILVPIDFSDASESAVQHAKEIAQTYGAEIDLLHVVEPPFYPSAYGIDSASFPTQEVVDRVEKQLGDVAREEIGYEHVMVEATVGHPPSEILHYVDENEVDLVVIATHGRTGLERALLGSVTERVLRQSPAPVFVVKPTRRSLLPSSTAMEDAE